MRSFIILQLLIFSLAGIINQEAYTSSLHGECKRIGNFRHHGAGIACLAENSDLPKEDLSHFIKKHLDTDIYRLDMSHQKYLDSSILAELAASKKGGAIRFLDLMYTHASYAGIADLWESPTFGNLSSDLPTYEPHTGNPLSTIKIEIGHTRVYKQYQDRVFNYPLPLLKDFQITYGHRCIGASYKMTGYKEIKLLSHGKELKKRNKK